MPLLLTPLTPVTDNTGTIRTDAVVHVYDAGTTQPALSYLDAAFDVVAPNPIPATGGRVPAVYVAPGEYRVRAESTSGEMLCDFDGLVIAGATVSSGEGGTVDPSALWLTGDIKDHYGTGTHIGWVRANGRTIGPTGSGATERQNDDAQALFLHLWDQDTNLAVAGGRGASAAADWSAAKTIALPDMRGRLRVALDNLGTTAAGRLAGAAFTFGSPTRLGSYGGAATHVLSIAQLPSHTHGSSASSGSAGSHTHTGTTASDGTHNHDINVQGGGSHSHSGTTNGGGSHNHSLNINSGGGHTHSATCAPAGAHSHTYNTAGNKGGGADAGVQITSLWYNGNDAVSTTTEPNHTHTINIASDGAHSHGGSTSTETNHTHTFATNTEANHTHNATSANAGAHTHTFTTAANGSHTHVITVSVTATGSGQAFSQLPPFVLVTTYIKL